MRLLATATLSVSVFCSPLQADPAIDSLFKHADVVVLGHVLKTEVSGQGNLQVLTAGTFDLLVLQTCVGGKSPEGYYQDVQPYDTLKELACLFPELSDTFRTRERVVIPLVKDSTTRSGYRLVVRHVHYGTFMGTQHMVARCPVMMVADESTGEKKVARQTITYDGPWTIYTRYAMDSTVLSTDATKHTQDQLQMVLKRRRKEYRNGKLWNSTTEVRRGGKWVYWKFRKDGKRTLKRGAWRPGKF